MRHLSLFLLAVVSSLSLSAATTYDFSSSIPLGWVSDPDPKGYETSGEARGTQYEKSATLTLSGVSDVTSVTIVASCNYDKDPNSYTLAVTVGNKQFGSYTLQKVTNETYTFSGEAADGDLVVTITKNGTKKSLWIKSITVEGNVPEPENPADRLDPEYIYDEPTVIEPKDELGKMALDTIINNVLLTCPFGAYYTTDIRVMAGNTITFTATQPIKAIRIDGGVKKAFEAEASAGFLTYRVDYENDIESASPVLLIKDIDALSVSLTCQKQLQMQKIYVYFEENPDVEIPVEEEAVPLVGCTITSEGEWNFVSAFMNTDFLWSVGTITAVLYTNPDWYLDSDGYTFGDGDGVQLVLDFTPTYINDWSGTYSIEAGSISEYSTWAYEYIQGEAEGEDQPIMYAFPQGTITLTPNEDTYTLVYSLTDTEEITHTGTILDLCTESARPEAIDQITNDVLPNDNRYNILGQPVDASYRGIIIQNRHKYLIIQ